MMLWWFIATVFAASPPLPPGLSAVAPPVPPSFFSLSNGERSAEVAVNVNNTNGGLGDWHITTMADVVHPVPIRLARDTDWLRIYFVPDPELHYVLFTSSNLVDWSQWATLHDFASADETLLSVPLTANAGRYFTLRCR